VKLLAEAFGWFPWLAERIVRRAVRALPPPEQERYEREWLVELDAVPGPALSKLAFALTVMWKTRATSAALRVLAAMESQKAPDSGAFLVAGAGFEPATSGL
jgi:hypothetical protein